MLEWVMTACEDADVKDMCIVKGFGAEIIENYVGDRCTILKSTLQTEHTPFLKPDPQGINRAVSVTPGQAPV